MKTVVGMLHPGTMGVSVAVAAMQNARVIWASHGRSTQSRERAAQHRLTDVDTVAAMCNEAEFLISVCPPHAAEDVAREVIGHGYKGRYLDANAISPQRMRRIAGALVDAGCVPVDGGIIGAPAWSRGGTTLALSGSDVGDVEALFNGSNLQTQNLGSEIGRASALKMCYAAWSKGSTALLAAVLAASGNHGVREALEAHWNVADPGMMISAAHRISAAAPKAWRWVGEMHEIADTFEAIGQPREFYDGAAKTFEQLAGFRDASISLEEALAELMH